MDVSVYDPWASREEVKQVYAIDLMDSLDGQKFDAVILSVSHNQFTYEAISKVVGEQSVIYDVKGVLPKDNIDKRL
jgi:UDP-N-acetyl-D-galactosamine dehydrogenase